MQSILDRRDFCVQSSSKQGEDTHFDDSKKKNKTLDIMCFHWDLEMYIALNSSWITILKDHYEIHLSLIITGDLWTAFSNKFSWIKKYDLDLISMEVWKEVTVGPVNGLALYRKETITQTRVWQIVIEEY